MSSHLTVIFDVDDVLIPLAERIHEAINAAGLNPNNAPMTQWEMWLDYGCSKDDWIEVFSSLAVPDGIYHAAPYPGVAQALGLLEREGADIHLVTARGFHAHADEIREWTRQWKRMWDIPGTLHFSNKKGEKVVELGADYAIDDALHNVRDMQDAGATAYLMNRPHNSKDYWHPRRRVDRVSQFVGEVLDV